MKPSHALTMLAACAAVASVGVAQTTQPIRFNLEQQPNDHSKIRGSFENQARDGYNRWSSGFMPSELIGLEVSSFHASGTRPIHFAIVRDAGRLDCDGSGGGGSASGVCRFAEDPRFSQLLISRGIGRPSADQSFAMMAVNVRHQLVEAITAARYPTPGVNDLVALAALGADGAYISDMSRAGYRPSTIQKLIAFKALGITPGWMSGFAQVGYANLPGDGLIQLRALGITPEYIRGFQRIGYRDLPVNTLVQLKALGITPEFVRSVARHGEPMPPINKLAELWMFSKRH